MKRVAFLVVIFILLAVAIQATVALAAPAKNSSGGGGGGPIHLMAGVRTPGLAVIGMSSYSPWCGKICWPLPPQPATIVSSLASIFGPREACPDSYCAPWPPLPVAIVRDFALSARGSQSSGGGRAPALAILGWGPNQKWCADQSSCVPLSPATSDSAIG